MKRGQSVVFSSRALTDAETRHAQIEKEKLAVFFLQQFDQYAYRRTVTIESDHKPLGINHKEIVEERPQETAMYATEATEVKHHYHIQARASDVPSRFP